MHRFDPEQLKMAIKNLNTLYSGLNTNYEKTIHVRGSLDPWSTLGFTENGTKNTIAIKIKGKMSNLFYLIL